MVSNETMRVRIQFTRETNLIFSENFNQYCIWMEAKLADAFEGMNVFNDLIDLQNGPPLETHRIEFEETIVKAHDFIDKWYKPIP